MKFFLPEFDQLRIPQWAARAEYFMDGMHAELLWIPLPAIDNIGKPGSDFYGFVPTVSNFRIAGEERPDERLGNANWGARLSALVSGWDMSAFFYRSVDVAPTYFLTAIDMSDPLDPEFEFTPRHERIRQIGATFSKDLGGAVFRANSCIPTDARSIPPIRRLRTACTRPTWRPGSRPRCADPRCLADKRPAFRAPVFLL